MQLDLISLLLGSVGSLGCLIGAFFVLRRKRLIDDIPTSKAQGVFIGLVELKGTAESEKPLTSYLAGIRCVQCAWQVDEKWSRTVVTTTAQGLTHSHTESGWTRVTSGSLYIPFYLKDDTGVIRIVPARANIHGVKVFDQTCSRVVLCTLLKGRRAKFLTLLTNDASLRLQCLFIPCCM